MRFSALACCLLLVSCGTDFTGDEGQGGDGGTGGSSTSSGTGGSTTASAGCSDGSRELFTDLSAQPDIAGCEGGFSVPGVTTPASRELPCNREAGNNSENATGEGCSVADLCAVGWHVCDSDADAAASLKGTKTCPTTAQPTFWITRQATDGSKQCVTGGVNNVVGCGTSVGEPAQQSCTPLNTMMLFSHCDALTAWDCGTATEGAHESQVVTKSAYNQGGALCCRDQ
ncbi:MAG: hypothetical protein DRI90_01395 [Deltaproteobacteria bacterium]|nr:MAG: hypothetical protein DRI90_01395 [Deltaproteobacteria bacterium]